MPMAKRAKIRVLITGGPTRAYLDGVRFLSNISSGELAYELAKRLKKQGVEVALVAGPTCQDFKSLKLKHYHPIETHTQMAEAVFGLCKTFQPHAAIFAAAVLDFAPVEKKVGKVRSSDEWVIRLRPTMKIIDEVKHRFPLIRRAGFKLEWEAEKKQSSFELAQHILTKNQLDALCLNYLTELKSKKHPAYLIDKRGPQFKAKTKKEIAKWLTEWVFTPNA